MNQHPAQPQARQQQYQQNTNQQYYQSQNNYAGGSQAILGQPQHLNFSQSIGYIFAHMFEFGTNVQDNQKSIFWWNYLVLCMFGFVLLFVEFYVSVGLSYLMGLLMNFTYIASMMRRLNYLGKNRNIAWLMFIPFVNMYPFILMFLNKKN